MLFITNNSVFHNDTGFRGIGMASLIFIGYSKIV